MAWDLNKYEPVADRILRFYVEHPEGRIETEIIDRRDGEWLVKAFVYREASGLYAATGYAHEVVTQKGVNSTSALENCETSAVGRALANLGYSPKGGERPSREEMTKVAEGTPVTVDDVDEMKPNAIGKELAARALQPGGTVPEMRERLRAALEVEARATEPAAS